MYNIDVVSVKKDICTVGKLLYDRGYVISNDGNISVRISENEIIITPSGVGKGRMTPDMMVHVNLDGEILHGDRYPSSEVKMHLAVYKNRPDIGAVVHAHPPLATSFAICRKPLDKKYSPEIVLGIGDVPVADFALPSTEAVPESVVPFVKDHKALLLANHGALSFASELWQAFDIMEGIENAAKITLTVEKIGGAVEISKDEIDTLFSFAENYKKLSQKRD